MIWVLWINQKHHDFDGRKLTLKSLTDEAVMMVDDEGNEASLTGPSDLYIDGGSQIVQYMKRKIQCTIDWNDSGNFLYTFSDDTTLTLPPQQVSLAQTDIAEAYDLTPLQNEELYLITKMQLLLNKGSTLPVILWKGLVSLVVLLIGMAMLCFPEASWKISTFLIVHDGEPTGWAITSSCLSGAVLIVASFVIPFIW